jgi:hypothetical protein
MNNIAAKTSRLALFLISSSLLNKKNLPTGRFQFYAGQLG